MGSAWLEHLTVLYEPSVAAEIESRIETLVAAYAPEIPVHLRGDPGSGLTEKDAILITYADQVLSPPELPLQTLTRFATEHLAGMLSAIHILPFYPWSSDDGFSVKDYLAVAPEYGTWTDIHVLGQTFELMFDAVFNHMSAQSQWFEAFLADDPGFRDFFVTVEGAPDLTAVVRPRALPLLTEFTTTSGTRKVWTTFSADQVDLNIASPQVLLALIEVLLFYVSSGARYIRLDAIAYLCKKIGTSCIHLSETHHFIRLMRSILDRVAPRVVLITETNVAHLENLSYFGENGDEAQMIYNFALPPLVMHSIRTGNSTSLTRWAATLRAPFPRTTFFNFLASHDGIGLNPVRGILTPAEIESLVTGTLRRNGLISYKFDTAGAQAPYEMNINYLDALADPDVAETPALLTRKLLTAHALMFALPGVPGIYFHSLFGSRGDRAGAEQSGINRRINRQKLLRADIEADLGTVDSLRRQVFEGFRQLLKVRTGHAAFAPAAACEVLEMDPRVFTILRGDSSTGRMLCLHNLSGNQIEMEAPLPIAESSYESGASRTARGIHLEPYGCSWILASTA